MTACGDTLPQIVIGGVAYDDLGYCRTRWGGLNGDGPVIHTAFCLLGDGWGDSATSGSDCIRPGQDGAAIKAARDAEAEKRRFTPPEYREGSCDHPGPVIALNRQQRTSIVALRGRPRGSDGAWTTWEVFDEPLPNDILGAARALTEPARPCAMTKEEATVLVEEFTTRVPHYEFQVVRGRLVIEEERLA